MVHLFKSFIKRIIPRLRSEVFEGVHILFSSVIPLDTKAETTEIWRMAHMFGARCSTELTGDITHVVAAKVCDFPTQIPGACLF
jgi:RNA polymerase II subunit A-like phosphatase